MKFVNIFLGSLSAGLLMAGIWFRYHHQPVGYALVALAATGLVLLLIRLLTARNAKSIYTVNLFWGFTCCLLIVTGLLFKLMQYPGANVWVVLGCAILLFQFVPVFILLQFKNDNDRQVWVQSTIELKQKLEQLPFEKNIAIDKPETKALDTLSIPTMQGLLFLKTTDIIYMEADDRYTKLFLKDKRMELASRTLGDFEELLKQSGFVRIHNSYLINLQYLNNYLKGEGGQVIMNNGTVLDVSRRKKPDLLSAVSHFK